MENQTEFKDWARVEVMGHQTHIGFTQTQAFGGTVMFRVDQPEIPAARVVLTRPEYVTTTEGRSAYAPAGSEVDRGLIPAATVLVGAGSIYRIIPCTEEAAIKAIRESVSPPLILVKLAEMKAISSGVDDEIVGSEDEDDDECPI